VGQPCKVNILSSYHFRNIKRSQSKKVELQGLEAPDCVNRRLTIFSSYWFLASFLSYFFFRFLFIRFVSFKISYCMPLLQCNGYLVSYLVSYLWQRLAWYFVILLFVHLLSCLVKCRAGWLFSYRWTVSDTVVTLLCCYCRQPQLASFIVF
jgi:hypothetical protein